MHLVVAHRKQIVLHSHDTSRQVSCSLDYASKRPQILTHIDFDTLWHFLAMFCSSRKKCQLHPPNFLEPDIIVCHFAFHCLNFAAVEADPP